MATHVRLRLRSGRMTGAAASLVALLMAAGCVSASVTAPGDGAGIDADAPVATSAPHYTLRPSGSGLAVDIPIRFRNTTDRTISIVNCHGALAPVLEKRVAGAWQPFWHGVQLLCLSSPIVVPPGGSIERTISIWGALPPSNAAPEFASRDVDGTYRIVLGSMVFDYDASTQGFGSPVPLEFRVSNPFELRR